MPLVIKLHDLMFRKKISAERISQEIGLHPTNISLLKLGKAKSVRFTTIVMLCQLFECQPGDLFAYEYDEKDPKSYRELPEEDF